MVVDLTEKYRPKTIDEIIGQPEAVSIIRSLHDRGALMGSLLLFSGPPGVGKTTMAHVVARMLFGDSYPSRFVEFNASDERGIDFVRGALKQMMTVAGERVIFLDEADSLTQDAQEAMRRIIENPRNKTKTKTLIMCVNDITQVIDPIVSRFIHVPFRPIDNKSMQRILVNVLKSEGWKFHPEATDDEKKDFIRQVIIKSGGDARRCLRELERSVSVAGYIIVPDGSDGSDIYGVALEAVKKALHGSVDDALELIDQVPDDRSIGTYVIKIWKSFIQEDQSIPEKTRATLLMNLAVTDVNMRRGTPIVQLMGFLSLAWLASLKDGKDGGLF